MKRPSLRPSVLRRVPDDATLIVASLIVYVTAFAVDHRARYLFGDSASYVQQAHSWGQPGPFLFIRERADLFTVLWSPFLSVRHGFVGLMALDAVLTIAAAVGFRHGLRRLGVRRRWALLAALGATAAPYVVYAQRLVLSEPLSYAAMLVIVALLCWACRPVRLWRLAVTALVCLLANGILRPSFEMTWLAVLAAAGVVGVWQALRHRPGRRTVGRWVAWGAVVAVAGAAGAVAISCVQGAVSDLSPMTQLADQSAYSGIQLIGTYGSLVPCGDPTTAAARGVCSTVGHDGTHASANYNDYVWRPPIHSQWRTPDEERFRTIAKAYRSLAIRTVLTHPAGAVKIALTNAVQLLDPIGVERYMEDNQTLATSPSRQRAPGERRWLRTVREDAPAFPIDQQWGPARTDWIYLAASSEAHLRWVALALVIGIALRRRRMAPLVAILTLAWVINLLGLAATSVPTTRYLLALDPLLLAALALSGVGAASARSGSAVTGTP